jgi:hypothetical protein
MKIIIHNVIQMQCYVHVVGLIHVMVDLDNSRNAACYDDNKIDMDVDGTTITTAEQYNNSTIFDCNNNNDSNNNNLLCIVQKRNRENYN